jgi:hypothetical protein
MVSCVVSVSGVFDGSIDKICCGGNPNYCKVDYPPNKSHHRKTMDENGQQEKSAKAEIFL